MGRRDVVGRTHSNDGFVGLHPPNNEESDLEDADESDEQPEDEIDVKKDEAQTEDGEEGDSDDVNEKENESEIKDENDLADEPVDSSVVFSLSNTDKSYGEFSCVKPPLKYISRFGKPSGMRSITAISWKSRRQAGISGRRTRRTLR